MASGGLNFNVGDAVDYATKAGDTWHAVVTRDWGDGTYNIYAFPPNGAPAVAIESVVAAVSLTPITSITIWDSEAGTAVQITSVNGKLVVAGGSGAVTQIQLIDTVTGLPVTLSVAGGQLVVS